MMSSTYLEYEVALLFAKYGKSAVLNALATKMQLSPEELESLLQEIPSKKAQARSRKTPAAVDSIAEIVREHPAKAHLVRTLHGRFQNRTFLPELRDVRRFFEQHSRNLGAIKSRTESFRRLFKLLAELDLPELDTLCQAEPQSAYSSLGVISDEILRRDRALSNG
jgi:hypothetical protein